MHSATVQISVSKVKKTLACKFERVGFKVKTVDEGFKPKETYTVHLI